MSVEAIESSQSITPPQEYIVLLVGSFLLIPTPVLGRCCKLRQNYRLDINICIYICIHTCMHRTVPRAFRHYTWRSTIERKGSANRKILHLQGRLRSTYDLTYRDHHDHRAIIMHAVLCLHQPQGALRSTEQVMRLLERTKHYFSVVHSVLIHTGGS